VRRGTFIFHFNPGESGFIRGSKNLRKKTRFSQIGLWINPARQSRNHIGGCGGKPRVGAHNVLPCVSLAEPAVETDLPAGRTAARFGAAAP